MLTREEKRAYRSDLFRHLDGIVTAPTAYVLKIAGVLDFLLEEKKATIAVISKQFKANEGYLNVALRVLAAQGWLDYEIDNTTNTVVYSINKKSPIAFKLIELYKDVYELLILSGKFHPRRFERAPFERLTCIFERFKSSYGVKFSKDPETLLIQQQVLKHLEGAIIGPSIVALGMNGMFHKYFMEASFRPEEFHNDAKSFSELLDFFEFLGWFEKQKTTYRFTNKGLFFAKRASAYGVTVSYNNTFRHLKELIFGNPKILWETEPGAPEKQVDRVMNVWGSGGAHGTYFKKVDEIIISIFNQPISEQPKGIVDMGCGNGAYLQHLYEVIEKQTLRGKQLEDHPLFLVGADYNEAALKVTRKNLFAANIWAKVMWGDIGRPDLLAKDLKEEYGIDLRDLLNVRTFLDHNRIWKQPDQQADWSSTSSGAFAFRGQRLSNNDVEASLLEHFNRWAPYVERFGLLVIELHTISSTLAAEHLGQTAVTAYDATHGFSDQYIVEIEVFNKIAKQAGLEPDERYFSKFPNSALGTVSINLLKGRQE